MRPLACKATEQEFKIADQIFANDIRGKRNSANGKPLLLKLPLLPLIVSGIFAAVAL
jgi:hypothetical protein